MKITCEYCGRKSDKPTGAVNRAKKQGLNIYCDSVCAGLGRRDKRTKQEKVEAKRLYDLEYRKKNKEILKEKKHKWFKETYDPVKAAEERKKKMPRHIEYCRQPEYKQYKKRYDRVYRTNKEYGEEWGPVMSLVLDLNQEIKSRATRHEIYMSNNRANKKQQRRKDYENLISSKS